MNNGASATAVRREQLATAANVARACRDIAATLEVLHEQLAGDGADPARRAARELFSAGLADALRRLDGWLDDSTLDELSRRRCLHARRDAHELAALLREPA